MDLGARDAYGIPANHFGNVPEEFFGLVGRVVMMAATVEDRLVTLVETLTVPPVPQSQYAGQMANSSLDLIERLLTDRPGVFAGRVRKMRADLEPLLKLRNAVVHSLWPNPTMAHAYGHRGVRKNLRVDDVHFSQEIFTNEADLKSLIGGLADMYSEIRDIEVISTLVENRSCN